MKIKYNTPFTIIENRVIRSSQLTIYQKLIYIALCSYANDSNICFPSYKTIAEAVGCSRRKAIDTIKELVDLKLIVKHESKNTVANEYEIVTGGEYPAPSGAEETPDSSADGAPSGACDAPKEYPNKNIKDFNNIHPSISRYDADTAEELIKINIAYDIIATPTDKEQIDGIVAIMVDTICGTSPSVRIGGSDFPRAAVISRLMELNDQHIQYVMEVMGKSTTKIRNIRAYMLTSLYNAPATIDSYYRAEVNHDLYGT